MATASDFFARHRGLLEGAIAALRSRGCWSAFPEAPSGKLYGETARNDGLAAFDARRHRPFDLDLPGTIGEVGAERSPYGLELGISYPRLDLDRLVAAAMEALAVWCRVPTESRVGIALEILHRLNRRSFEIAYATMHTSGQPFLMAFQAGGPHAQDRALEAIAVAWLAMTETPRTARWEKPMGKGPAVVFEKTYEIVPAGLAVVIGCATFATWNSYPGLFASLVTGNPVIVKPHPQGILPLAITVETAREVLRETGLDPDIVLLCADEPAVPVTADLVRRPEIRIVDYTGGPAFGDRLETELRHARVFTEKAGVNAVIIDGTSDFDGMVRNLATTLALYSGQMCTTPQVLFVGGGGISTPDGIRSVEEFSAALCAAIEGMIEAPSRAVELLGAIQSLETVRRIETVAAESPVLLASRTLRHPDFPEARIRTPLVLAAAPQEIDRFGRELFGPISFVVATGGLGESLALATDLARRKGAITWSAYASDPAALAAIGEASLQAGVALSENLTGAALVNQSAAFSDFHVSGANPAGNAALTDAAFIAGRFRVVQRRRQVAPTIAFNN
jgi:phenylacetic acid degradation protein paaN